MEKTNNNIPTAEELAIYIKEATVSVTNTYEQSPVVLMVDNSIIGTLGNFSASIGKAKSKKTFNVSAIAASALANGTVLHYRSSFPENKRTILYIDTEQGEPHCQKVLQRILCLAGLPKDADSDNLIMLGLRKYSPEMRLAIVEQAIGTIPNLGLVIIDGIRDFMYDINSPNEATNIISKFMQWTDDRQIHIHTVLHQNKNDEHARGHIGTELNNKAETIMQIEVDKEDKTALQKSCTRRICPICPKRKRSDDQPKSRLNRTRKSLRMYIRLRWMPPLQTATSATTMTIWND